MGTPGGASNASGARTDPYRCVPDPGTQRLLGTPRDQPATCHSGTPHGAAPRRRSGLKASFSRGGRAVASALARLRSCIFGRSRPVVRIAAKRSGVSVG